VTGYSDWETEVTDFKGDNRVPESCCKGLVADDKVDSCKKSPGDVEQPSKLKGCWTKFNDNVKKTQKHHLGGQHNNPHPYVHEHDICICPLYHGQESMSQFFCWEKMRDVAENRLKWSFSNIMQDIYFLPRVCMRSA